VIVGFCAAAGEDDFLRTCAEKRSDLFSRGFDGGAGALPGCVDGSCVTEITGKVGKHGVEDRRFDGGGGVVIEINARHGKVSVVDEY